MDEYAFAYVSQENSRLESLRPPSPQPSPVPLPLKAKVAPVPPRASIRPRADSLPKSNIPSAYVEVKNLNYEALATPPWYASIRDRARNRADSEDEGDSSDDEAFEDAALVSLRDTHIAHLASCRKLLDHATTVLESLSNIQHGFEAVADQTSTLQASCNDLQAEETRLSRLADDVRDSLQPFSFLASANRLLNVPGSNLVLQPSYQDLLIKLQSSLDFLDAHRDYKDSELYTRQYRQAMTKALTLARVYFATSMRDISADITSRIQVNAMNKNTQSALLYTKFRSVVGLIRPLMRNIEDASIKHDEYWSLLNDCWLLYFSMRKSLLAPVIASSFKESSAIAALVPFSTSAISFMRVLALDEQELFSSFFHSGQEQFATYLATLGQAFTDVIRPRIAAESSLNTLCEICGGMQAQCINFSEDQESVIFDMSPILATTLGEIQSRILLRAQGVVINEIQGYKPSEKDLDYPNCLRKQKRPYLRTSDTRVPGLGLSFEAEKQESSGAASPRTQVVENNDLESLNSTVLYEKWYVTLRVSISLLSKIYKLVQSTIFDDLAHEVVRSCIASLLHASNLIKRRNSVDGHLFLLKHLLILKEQIAGFDIEHSEGNEGGVLDLSTVTGAFWDLTNRSASELFAPTALYNLASSTLSRLSSAGYLSRKVENMTDAREELDDQTRLVIGTLTLHCADSVTVPLRSAMGNKSQNTKDLLEANRKFRASCPDSFTLWQDSFELYMADERVSSVLIGIIQDKVLETYERFDTYVRELKRQKTLDGEAIEVEVPTVMQTVDWLREISTDERNGHD